MCAFLWAEGWRRDTYISAMTSIRCSCKPYHQNRVQVLEHRMHLLVEHPLEFHLLQIDAKRHTLVSISCVTGRSMINLFSIHINQTNLARVCLARDCEENRHESTRPCTKKVNNRLETRFHVRPTRISHSKHFTRIPPSSRLRRRPSERPQIGTNSLETYEIGRLLFLAISHFSMFVHCWFGNTAVVVVVVMVVVVAVAVIEIKAHTLAQSRIRAGQASQAPRPTKTEVRTVKTVQ